MPVRDHWVNNTGTRIHYLESEGFEENDNTNVPLLYIPGMLGSAEQFSSEFAVFSPRRCIALSLRGRGKSDAPQKGYSFGDHVTDIEAVVRQAKLTDFCLMAYSMGVPYAIEYAASNPGKLKGLVLCDYPARYPSLPMDWVNRVLSNFSPEEARPHVIHALQSESSEILLWDCLRMIKCPVLIVYGKQADSLLSEENAELYRKHLVNPEVVAFEESGHELWDPDYSLFVTTIQNYLEKLDTSAS